MSGASSPTSSTEPSPDSRHWATLIVPGEPVPLERARTGKGRHYLPDRSRVYREAVQWAWRGAGSPVFSPPVTLAAKFTHARPASHIQRDGRVRDRFTDALPRGDIDNYLKAVLDALTGLAYEDDRQVALVVYLAKRYGAPAERPCTEIRLHHS
jgi:Holliday junction resolvase RusA-like endonuclease